MINMYDSALKMRNYRPTTRKKNIQIVRKFLTSTPLGLPDIKPDTIESYLISLMNTGRSGKTIDNHRSALKGFFDYLLLHQITKYNPAMGIKRLELPETLPIFLPDNEIELLIELATTEKIVTEIIVALNTGLRLNELRHLRWRDIDLTNKQLIVEGTHTKSKRPRTVPLNEKALKALTAHKYHYRKFYYVFPGGKGGTNGRNKWTENTMRSYKWWLRLSLDRIREQIPTIAGIQKGKTGRGWHIMRHTFATKLAQAGVDMFKIQDWMGHKKIETTMRYVHLARHYDPDIELI